MVCVRCKMAVAAVLEACQVRYQQIELGWVRLETPLRPEQKRALSEGLKRYELELMGDKNQILVERIKTALIGYLQSPRDMRFKLSAYLSRQLDYNYTYLANTFSELEGMTLERYFIAQRIERAKELMRYEEFSLLQVTEELNFSSVSHLCQQFKKVTGSTPAEFKKQCQQNGYIWQAIEF